LADVVAEVGGSRASHDRVAFRALIDMRAMMPGAL
jgi:hypothetical protein